MRVVHYMREIDLATGGVVRAVLDLAQAAADAGASVTILSSDLRDAPEAWKREGANPGVVDLGPVGGAFGMPPLMRERAGAIVRGADVVHLHGIWNPRNADFGAMAAGAGTPYIVSCHGMLDDWSMAQKAPKKRAYLALRGSKMLRRAAAVHCTAQLELEQARKRLPRDNGAVVPLIMVLDDYRDLPGPGAACEAIPALAGELPKVLFLSRVHPKKRPEVLIDAAAELKRRGTPHVCVIVGPGEDGYVHELRARAERAGVADLVTFPGLVSGRTKVSVYQAADLFVLPTSQENFGFVFFEALASGTALITTKGVDTWGELESSGGAEIVEETVTPGELAGRIAAMTGDRAALAARGERGRAWVLAEMSAGRTTERLMDLYRRCAATARRP